MFNGAPALLFGIEDPRSNAHAPNESLDLGIFRKLTLSLAHLFENVGNLPEGRVKKEPKVEEPAMAAASPTPRADEPLQGGMLWLAAIVLAAANFIAVLDMTIANVSVPNIAGSLGISSSQGTWVITSYAVAEAIVVPLTLTLL